jgi:probable phosphoglycerate mutase
VLTSPLARATDTAALAGYEGAQRREDLREWDYGAYEGLTLSEIQAKVPGWNLWANGVERGESAAQVAQRADRVIAEARSAEGNVLIFSHGHLLRVFASRWLSLPPEAGRMLLLATTSVCVLMTETGRGVLSLWNDRSHLHSPRLEPQLTLMPNRQHQDNALLRPEAIKRDVSRGPMRDDELAQALLDRSPQEGMFAQERDSLLNPRQDRLRRA